MSHTLTLDHTPTDHVDTEAFQTYCSCGWDGEWHHADDNDPDEAERRAVEDGEDHLAYIN